MEYGFHLRKNGYRVSSIDRSVRVLRRLSKHCNLMDAEGVKSYLSTLEWSLGTKEIASNVLNSFYKLQGIPFSKPRYRRVDKLIAVRIRVNMGRRFRQTPRRKRYCQTS